MLIGGLFSADYAVPYWGPYSEAWDPSELFLSPNMGQVYAGALPMLAILMFGVARGLAWTREIAFFAIALLVLIVYALGRYTPVFRVIFDLLPGVKRIPPAGRCHVPDRRHDRDPRRLPGASRCGRHCIALRRWHTLAALALVGVVCCRNRGRDLGRASSRCALAARQGGRLGRRRRARTGRAVAPAAALGRACRTGRGAADDRRSRGQQRPEQIDRAPARRVSRCWIRTPRTRRSCCSSGCCASRCRPTGATASNCSALGSSGQTPR